MDSSTNNSSDEKNNDLVSLSSSTPEDEKIHQPRKRYKEYLHADHQTDNVSQPTRKRWENKTGNRIGPLQSNNFPSLSRTSENDNNLPSSADSPKVSSLKDHAEENLDTYPNDINNDCLMSAAFFDNCSFDDDHIDDYSAMSQSSADVTKRSDDDSIINTDRNDHENNGSDNEDFDQDDESFDRIMFDSAHLSVRDVIIMISAISLKFHFFDEARLALTDFLKLCAGPNFDNIKLSKHEMDKCFSSQAEHISYYYYCQNCSNQVIFSSKAKYKVKNQNVVCLECQENNKVSATSKYYFTELDIEYQFNQLFSNSFILDDLVHNLIKQQNKNGELAPDGKIRDVHDGIVYKKMMLCEKNDDYFVLSVNGSTNGAPLSRSGSQNFWGYQMTLNDLSLKHRFRHILLTGIIITEKEPRSGLMNLYTLKVFVEPINRFYEKGIRVQHQGREILLKICAGNIIADSVARPVIQNRISHSGYYGCSWCYSDGTHIAGHDIHYLMEDTMAENRTNDSHNIDVRLFEYKIQNNVVDVDSKGRKKKNTTARGVKGCSALQKLPNFNMVWSFPYEMKHGLFSGVVYQLWGEGRSSDSVYKIKLEHVKDIEKRYSSITPTHDVHRLSRSGIILGKAKPKASELRSWLFLFSLTCLNGILHEDALLHFSKLVKSAYVLSKLEISENELIECEREFKEFVEFYEVMYGPHRMILNVHTLLHCTESVRQTGPLPVTSASPNESKIYQLKQYSSAISLKIAKI